MMRRQYASEDTDTYVEYVFSYRGQEYTVRRNPEYLRVGEEKKSKWKPPAIVSKTAGQSPSGWKGISGEEARDTTRRFRKSLVLMRDSLAQIAMIAQGDFLKLLHAESKERKKIFSQIFQTQIYWQIQEALKRKRKRSVYCAEGK